MVKEYDSSKYRMLCSWWESWGLPVIPQDMLPTYGLTVSNIAAGFLIVTDCNLGFLEFFISNPESDEKMRDLALDQITKGLMEYGNSVGITNFKCDTQLDAIRRRAERFGFKPIGEYSAYFMRG